MSTLRGTRIEFERGRTAIILYSIGAPTLFLNYILSDILGEMTPEWLSVIAGQTGPLLSLIMASLLVLSILLRSEIGSVIDSAAIASAAAIVVGYFAAIFLLRPEHPAELISFMVISSPLMTALDTATKQALLKWAASVVVGIIVMLAALLIYEEFFNWDNSIAAAVMLLFFVAAVLSTRYGLRGIGDNQPGACPRPGQHAQPDGNPSTAEGPPVTDTDQGADTILGAGARDYSGEYHTHMLRQYETFVEIAGRNRWRLQLANALLLTLNLGILALAALLLSGNPSPLGAIWIGVTAAIGIALSITWSLIVKGNRDSHTGIVLAIRRMEEHLPFKPFSIAWNEVEEKESWSLFRPIMKFAVYVPLLFVPLYLVLFAIIVR